MRRLLIIAIFLSLTIAVQGTTEAQQPVQQSIPPVQHSAKDTTNHHDKAYNPQNITIDFPTTLNLNISGKLGTDTPKTKKDPDPEPFKYTDWLLAISTVLLFIVTVVLGWIAYYQLCTTRTTPRSYIRI